MNEEIIQNLNERLDRAIDKGREIITEEEMEKRLNEMKDQTEDTIRRYPIASVAVGLAVGFIAAKIFTSDH
ncbi:hypothetical protein [Gracilimonas mengyeensis]|uniref:DUF883 domain-containing protein n=1 Tax=Gracilimonas mengyeensis TaxID=1302730 RepID=A0A521E962_9BACT|nr:hypothetical protein [Gracilimonas mengyeensis]SMO80449.1 hypothetical protein SAMN06265219_11118 [Gracilimonas mengyeensis]